MPTLCRPYTTQPSGLLWPAVFAGHRRDNTSPAALGQWLRDRAIQLRKVPGDRGFANYAVMEQLTDRPPPSLDFITLIVSLDMSGEVRSGSDGKTYAGATEWGQAPGRAGPSSFGGERRKAIPANSVAPNFYSLFAQAYIAFRNQQYEEAVAGFDRLASYYLIEEGNARLLMPYFAFAAAKTGDALGLEHYLQTLPDQQTDFDLQLALASFSALRGDHEIAVQRLTTALRHRPGTAKRPLPTPYEYAETCIRLYEATRDARYRQLALDWARGMRRIDPAQAWAHALVARYGDDQKEQVSALATALWLDPQSAWIGELPEALKFQARNWMASHPPFQSQRVASQSP